MPNGSTPTPPVCRKEGLLGEHSAKLAAFDRQLSDFMSATQRQLSETVKQRNEFDRAFERLKTLFEQQQIQVTKFDDQQRQQHDTLCSINNTLLNLNNELSQIQVARDEHRAQISKWYDIVERRLRKLESVRYFIYAFFVLLVAATYAVVQLNDTWRAAEELMARTKNQVVKETIQRIRVDSTTGRLTLIDKKND